MRTYLCTRCPKCKSEVVLGLMPQQAAGMTGFELPTAKQTCAACGAFFRPKIYYTVQRENGVERCTGVAG